MIIHFKQKQDNYIYNDIYVSQQNNIKEKGNKNVSISKGIQTKVLKLKEYDPTKKQVRKSKIKYNQIDFNLTFHNTSINLINSTTSDLKPLMMFSQIAKKSIIDQSSRLYMYKDGRLEYFGDSPIGMLIIAYFTSNQQYNNNENKNKNKNKTDMSKVSTELWPYPRTIIRDETLIKDYFVEECLNAYFECYSHYAPVVDEILFRKNPQSVIRKALVAIGYRYLANGVPNPDISSKLDALAVSEYQKLKFKPNLTLVIYYTLISQYQSFLSESENAWFYQSLNSHHCRLLGLGFKPPKKWNFSDRYLRLRYNQWCACSIQDKMYSFVLSRPFNIEVGFWIQPSPNFPPLGKLSPYPDRDQRREVMERASFIYWRGKYLITEMLGSACILKKDWSISDPKIPNNIMIKFLKGFIKFDIMHRNTMSLLYKDQPIWVYNLCQMFLRYHQVFLNALVIETCNLYLKIPNYKPIPELKSNLLRSSLLVIGAAQSLGDFFLRYGTLFRIHSLSVATLTLGKLVHFGDSELSKDIIEYALFNYLDKKDQTLEEVFLSGLEILANTRHYFPMALEYAIAIIDFFKDK